MGCYEQDARLLFSSKDNSSRSALPEAPAVKSQFVNVADIMLQIADFGKVVNAAKCY